MHVYVRKVKVLSTPKMDTQALRDLHGGVTAQMDEDEGQPVDAGGEWQLQEGAAEEEGEGDAPKGKGKGKEEAGDEGEGAD